MAHFSTFLTLLAAAILRGLIAKGAGLALEAWFKNRFPSLPHLGCVVISILLAVIAVELLALGVESLISYFAKRE